MNPPQHKRVHKIVAKIRGHASSAASSTASSPSSSKPSLLLRSSAPGPTLESLSLELWNAAYDCLALDSDTAGLVLAYEAIVSQELQPEVRAGFDGSAPIAPERRPEVMRAIAAAGLRRGMKETADGGGDDGAREMLLGARKTVAQVMETYPSAALAWAGLCTLTPLLLDPLLAHEDVRTSLTLLTTHIPHFMALASVLLPSSWASPDAFRTRRDFARHTLLDLYRKALEVEMNGVCAAASAWNMAAKNVVDWGGWRTMAEAVREADGVLAREMEEYGSEQARDALRQRRESVDSKGDR